MTKPDAEQVLTQAIKDGAQGFGELKFHVAADGPELRRMYALAAHLRVPLLIHFQEVDHFPDEGAWSTGYAKTFESILKAYPRTTFCTDGHGAGVSQSNNPAAARMAGKCVGRETLSLLKRSIAADVFTKITWDNAHKLLRIPA